MSVNAINSLGIGKTASNAYKVNYYPNNFVQEATNKQFLVANPNCPEHRGNGVLGEKLYCLA